MKILAVSDQIVERVYTLASNGHFEDVELILSCGDLPYNYLEYLVTVLCVPLYYVPGNHDPEFNPLDVRSRAEGGSNLDLRFASYKNYIIGGFGGSICYQPNAVNQYSQTDAYWRAFRMLPTLLMNRIIKGRALDILITHSPAFGIHDDSDQAHQGFKALNWLIKIAKPHYMFHGHTHFYRNNISESESLYEKTKIINVYPYKTIEID